MPELTLDTPTIQVTIRDRSREAPWGTGGPISPCTRKVTISANCRTCGQPRGERRGSNECEDGAYYWVEQWDNACGHVDYYQEIAKEADELLKLRQDAYLRSVNPEDEVRFKFRFQLKDYDIRGHVTEVDSRKRQVFAVNVEDANDKGWLPFRYVVLPKAGS